MSDEVISAYEKYRIKRLDAIDSAYSMLDLVDQNYVASEAASKELILAICWEESFFQNVKQDGGPAVGYGQLERDGRRIANQHLANDYSDFSEGAFKADAILASKALSIQAVGHSLAGLMKTQKTKRGVLDAYAGVRARPANAAIPQRWLDAEAALRQVIAAGDDIDRLAFENALRLSRKFDEKGHVYDHIHGKLWPILDTIKRMVGAAKKGSQGDDVVTVQETLNRLQAAQPTGVVLTPLDPDGDFDQEVHDRVVAFQQKQNLLATGIVGPETLGAMASLAQKLGVQ